MIINKYIGNNKLANRVNIEAYSIEDNGILHFNVYVYNEAITKELNKIEKITYRY